MAFSSRAKIRRTRFTDEGGRTTITEETAEGLKTIWDSNSGEPDPDPFQEAWWKEFDTPDGYSKNGDKTFGSSQQLTAEGLKTVWDSRVHGIPEAWREEERQRELAYKRYAEKASSRQNDKPGLFSRLISFVR